MLIRFKVKNLFSFREETEFNTLPGRVKRLEHHRQQQNGIESLKLSAVYGANGSGKSNLVRSLSFLKRIVTEQALPLDLESKKFKLSKKTAGNPIEFSIEFVASNKVYYYSVAILTGQIIEEYLAYLDEDNEDKLLFHRTTINNKVLIDFFPEFLQSEENKALKKVIENDLLKQTQSLFYFLSSLSNEMLAEIKKAFAWIKSDLIIIYPNSRVQGLIWELESNPGFKEFAKGLMCSFQTGISNLKVETKSLDDFFATESPKEVEKIKAQFSSNTQGPVAVLTNQINNEEVAITNRDGQFLTQRLLFEHSDEEEGKVEFLFEEESDGTRRLLEYLPIWDNIISARRTYVVDEIERSIHPLIIKELLEKFSKDHATLGQLIFTTHESNLLDQEIFRSDEIWFAEKNSFGSSKFYPLSDFKEHSTIDIRKGYLNGRYGAIPFLGNLKDLNWHKTHVDEEK